MKAQLTIQEMVRAAMADLLVEMAVGLSPEVMQGQASAASPALVAKAAAPADGHGAAFVYIAGCSSLEEMSKRWKIPVFKMGTTRQSLEDRANALRGDRYGAAIKRGEVVILDAGFDDWEMRKMRPAQTAQGSPVTVVANGIQVALTKPFAAFEGAFRTLFRPRSLAAWAASELGRRHIAEHGIDPAEVDRYTVYGYGAGKDRVSRCTELYVLKPREHQAMIIEAIEESLKPG